jgi:hypothetical protein
VILRILKLAGFLIAAPIVSVLRAAKEELPYAGFTPPVYVAIAWAMATNVLLAPRFVAATDGTSVPFTVVLLALSLAAILLTAAIAVILGLAARTWMCSNSDTVALASTGMFLALLALPIGIIIAAWPF